MTHAGSRDHAPVMTKDLTRAASLIVFPDDMDKALAGFVLANGAADSGKSVTMFFTFRGLSVIKKHKLPGVRKDLMGIDESELMDGVDIGGVATYMDAASEGNVNLFI
ncbi:MAG: DsrE/DsrF/DrsH-like family protein [Rectinemataceae bacterium]|nr:DsrE/DsrF/DrsH-like family protein [Rectinemataceae bacterium]